MAYPYSEAEPLGMVREFHEAFYLLAAISFNVYRRVVDIEGINPHSHKKPPGRDPEGASRDYLLVKTNNGYHNSL